MKNMSFMLTLPQMEARVKSVTRRVGWWDLEEDDVVMAVQKGMGLKKGEKVVPIYAIQILSARSEPLRKLIDNPVYGEKEVVLEGFPDMTPLDFVQFFCDTHKCLPDKIVNRILFIERQ